MDHLINRLLHFEATPDGEPAIGGGEEPLAEGEAAAWAGPSEEEWQATQQVVNQIGELLQQQPQQQTGEGEQLPADTLLSPEEWQHIGQMIQQAVDPVAQFAQRSELSEAEERAMDIIADLQSSEGEFLLPERSSKLARTMAEQFFPEARERYGDTPKAAEAALKQAVAAVREMEAEIGKAYSERQSNQLHTLAGARREPPAAGTEGGSEIDAPVGSEMDVVRRYLPIR